VAVAIFAAWCAYLPRSVADGAPDLPRCIRAFDQAKAKAAALATRAGAILGAPITIEEGAEVVPDQPADARGPHAVSAPAPPTKPGASTVTATVRVIFALE
jgi:uncharacterized protein YggE